MNWFEEEGKKMQKESAERFAEYAKEQGFLEVSLITVGENGPFTLVEEVEPKEDGDRKRVRVKTKDGDRDLRVGNALYGMIIRHLYKDENKTKPFKIMRVGTGPKDTRYQVIGIDETAPASEVQSDKEEPKN